MRKLLLVLFWTCLASAQVIVGNFGVNYVTSAPSGNCSRNQAMRVVLGAGTVYTCQSGTWGQSGASTSPGGSDTQVQFNDGGVFAGASHLTWDKSTNVLTMTTPTDYSFTAFSLRGTIDVFGQVTIGAHVGTEFDSIPFIDLIPTFDQPVSDATGALFEPIYNASTGTTPVFNGVSIVPVKSALGTVTQANGLKLGDVHALGTTGYAIHVLDQTSSGHGLQIDGGANDLGPQATTVGSLKTATNCANASSPAACSSAAAGVVAVPTGTNPTLVINTTAVTSTSRIFLEIDESATIAATTCNTTLSTLVQPVVTARTAATSFTIQIGAILASNPACVSYFIVN